MTTKNNPILIPLHPGDFSERLVEDTDPAAEIEANRIADEMKYVRAFAHSLSAEDRAARLDQLKAQLALLGYEAVYSRNTGEFLGAVPVRT